MGPGIYWSDKSSNRINRRVPQRQTLNKTIDIRLKKLVYFSLLYRLSWIFLFSKISLNIG